MKEHPINPSDELIEQWLYDGQLENSVTKYIATQAARWGADQELDACCAWLINEGHEYEHVALRDARRPKPPSLKEQALYALDEALSSDCIHLKGVGDTIRRAIESLPD